MSLLLYLATQHEDPLRCLGCAQMHSLHNPGLPAGLILLWIEGMLLSQLNISPAVQTFDCPLLTLASRMKILEAQTTHKP